MLPCTTVNDVGVPEQPFKSHDSGPDEEDGCFATSEYYVDNVEVITKSTVTEGETEKYLTKMKTSANLNAEGGFKFNESDTIKREELYVQVLYELINSVGSESKVGKQDIFQYLQKAFCLDQEKHEKLLSQAQSKDPPDVLLNVQVLEAKQLTPYDFNGLSDPFCTLYLSSAPTHRYNTSVKKQTLSPVWNEHFSLLLGNPRNDTLCLEVWDFDRAESAMEKMDQISEVQGVKGLKMFLKDVTTTALQGKCDGYELIGSTIIHLKNVPPTGQLVWLNLTRKDKAGLQGMIRVMVNFSSEKSSTFAPKEHRHLLRILAIHEMESSQSNEDASTEWNGEFSAFAESVLQQHLAQSGMTEVDEALAQWVEYAVFNQTHTISCHLFHNILQALVKPISSSLLTEDEVKSFWDAAKKILPLCLKTIKSLRELTPAQHCTKRLLNSSLSILSTLSTMQPPAGTDLFPASMYNWLTKQNCDIKSALEATISQAAIDWLLVKMSLEHKKPNDKTNQFLLLQQSKMIELLKTDLQNAILFYDSSFMNALQVPYSKTIYNVYRSKVCEMTEPLVKDICASLKPIRDTNSEQGRADSIESDSKDLGTALFEFYLDLKRFADLGTAICSTEADNSTNIFQFHSWFSQGVAHWLDISSHKAMSHIERAVELDELTPVDAIIKHSSSAIDTLVIYNQIKIFWQQLLWPDVEESTAFMARIVYDICKCSVHYTELMVQKLHKMGKMNDFEEGFKVNNEWCLAVNSIDYVQKSIRPFIKELKLDDTIKISAGINPTVADNYETTLQMFVDNAMETIRDKTLHILKAVVEKMSLSIKKFLMGRAELVSQKNNFMDRLMQFLDENMTTLSSQLNPEIFELMLMTIIDQLGKITNELANNGIEEMKPPQFFTNLQKNLQTLVEFFGQGASENEFLSKAQKLLAIHGMKTVDLIMQVHLARLKEQQKMEDGSHGMLTVRLQFIQDTLRIEIMNGRDLKAMDSNKSSDPYVTIFLLPEEKFLQVPKPSTKTHKNTLFPLFDEDFSIQLTREQREAKDAMLLFIVRDEDFYGISSEFMGEAYYSLADIPHTSPEMRVQQIHLKLSKPNNFDFDEIRALDHRQEDKIATTFLKTQRSKRASK